MDRSGDRCIRRLPPSNVQSRTAALPDSEASRIIDANAERIEAETGRDRVALVELMAQTRRQGYAFGEGFTVRSMAALAVAIRGWRGEPLVTLGLTAITERLDGKRRGTVAGWLRAEATALEQHLNTVTKGLSAPAVRRLRSRS